jgi:hypothetical protein
MVYEESQSNGIASARGGGWAARSDVARKKANAFEEEGQKPDALQKIRRIFPATAMPQAHEELWSGMEGSVVHFGFGHFVRIDVLQLCDCQKMIGNEAAASLARSSPDCDLFLDFGRSSETDCSAKRQVIAGQATGLRQSFGFKAQSKEE